MLWGLRSRWREDASSDGKHALVWDINVLEAVKMKDYVENAFKTHYIYIYKIFLFF